MSSSLKKKPDNLQLSKSNKLSNTIGGDCDQYPTFSFRHLTTNSKYNFDHFGSSQVNDMKEAKYCLYDRIEELCRKSWMYWGSLNKQIGFEMLEYSRLRFVPTDLRILNDEKICIFQFKIQNKDARIIGFRVGKCPILHVIGYDLDYSAYNHGS